MCDGTEIDEPSILLYFFYMSRQAKVMWFCHNSHIRRLHSSCLWTINRKYWRMWLSENRLQNENGNNLQL